MKRFCFVMIVVAALVVAGLSNSAFAVTATPGKSIVSPYWEANANSTYTFIAISAPSISGALSRAVIVTAVSSELSTSSGTVTIGKGTTAKFFIVNTNHSSLNTNNVAGANWITVTGSGHVIITTPYASQGAGDLSAWGAIYFPSSTTGFAMEFIGDIADSTGGGTGDL